MGINKMMFDLLKLGRTYHYIITVCDAASAERCPIFPGVSTRLHWGFEDPSSFGGTDDEKISRTREVRDAISIRVKQFVRDFDFANPTA